MAAIEFHWIDGPETGSTKRFEDPNIYIAGHSPRCAISISAQDEHASSEHFMVEVNPPRTWIRDLGSPSGTFVNGRKLGQDTESSTAVTVELKSGDKIQAGQTTFEYIVADPGLSASDVYVYFESSNPTLLPQSNSGFTPPYKVPGFEIHSQSISGTMGAVFRAQSLQDGRAVTLKTITPVVAINTYRMNQIRRELEFIGEFDHPNVVSYVGGGQFSHGFYIATEHCEGGNIKDLVKERNRPFTEEETIPLLLDALRGLEYVHSKGIAHGDLKPSNLLLCRDQKTVKIGDLRLVKCYVNAGLSRLTMAEESGGTLHFMPVDQFINYKYSKPVGDIWSIGATLYRLLTGKYPYEFGENSDDVQVMIAEDIRPIRSRDSKLNNRLAEIVDKSVARDPGKRYQSAAEFRQSLENYWSK
jgi:eukaryotic-like serine/threonine-protein kinase